MITTITTDDAPIYVLNKGHKNLTQTNYMVPKGSEIVGEALKIEGLKNGQNFTYRIFKTNDNKIIHLNKTSIKMNTETEINLGADASVANPRVDPAKNNPSSVVEKTTVNIPLGSAQYKNTMYATIIGAGAGFGWAKFYKKEGDMKKLMYWTVGGGIAGAVLGYMLDKKVIVIKKN